MAEVSMRQGRSTPTSTKSPAMTAILLWWAGFKDACAVHRTHKFFACSRVVRVKTGRCFLFNGFIFLGSMVFMHHLILPAAAWVLRLTFLGSSVQDDPLMKTIEPMLKCMYNCLWLYPAYVMGFVVNCIWYQEIAKHAHATMPAESAASAQPHAITPRRAGIGAAIGEELFRVILFAVFMLQVAVSSWLPVVGKYVYFVLLSWLYAYYCFDYKWSIERWSLDQRLVFFESHWTYFAGFGSPCTLAAVSLPWMVGEGLMSTFFPLFVLVAMGSDVRAANGLRNSSSPHAVAPLGRMQNSRLYGYHPRGIIMYHIKNAHI